MIRDATLYLELPAPRRSVVHDFLVATVARVRRWYAVYRQRRALLALDDAMLKDIGLSRADAMAEGGKPFWRP